jgi:hypothetical protein
MTASSSHHGSSIIANSACEVDVKGVKLDYALSCQEIFVFPILFAASEAGGSLSVQLSVFLSQGLSWSDLKRCVNCDTVLSI